MAVASVTTPGMNASTVAAARSSHSRKVVRIRKNPVLMIENATVPMTAETTAQAFSVGVPSNRMCV